MGIRRFFRHLFSDHWSVRYAFPPRAMKAIEDAIGAQERRHDGELRFAVESALPFFDLVRGTSARDRAVEVFSRLRIWDTEQNAGVLVYLLLADKRVEIVADRGIHARVGAIAWETICGAMQQEFAAGRFESGMLTGLAAVSDLLQAHFPPQGERNPNELPDAPAVL